MQVGVKFVSARVERGCDRDKSSSGEVSLCGDWREISSTAEATATANNVYTTSHSEDIN